MKRTFRAESAFGVLTLEFQTSERGHSVVTDHAYDTSTLIERRLSDLNRLIVEFCMEQENSKLAPAQSKGGTASVVPKGPSTVNPVKETAQ